MIIEQVLHGYKDGHNLLASSIDISIQDRRIMRINSDMSGNMSISGVREYIKGYPLKESGKYAFAKTWYADEMDRPGCVWTHTILISYNDILDVSDVESLLSLFKRPNISVNRYSYYEKSINIQNNLSIPSQLHDYNYNDIRNLLYNFFSENSPVIIPLTNYTTDPNKIIISLWRILPFSLRATMTFCSYNTNLVEFDGKAVDLQFILGSRLSHSRFVKEAISSDHEISRNSNEIEFITDLVINPPVSYLSFLKTYSIDISSSRKKALSLFTLYNFLTKKEKLDETYLVNFLGRNFENSKEARRLKVALLNNENLGSVFSEKRILQSLLSTEYTEAFDYNYLNIEERIVNLISIEPQEGLELFSNILHNDSINNEQALIKSLSHLSTIISPNLMRIINNNYRELLSVLVQINPNIASISEYWNIEDKFQYDNFRYILNSNYIGIKWDSIVYSMIESNLNIPSKMIIDNIPNVALYTLNWVNKNGLRISSLWIDVLYYSKSGIIEWLLQNNILQKETFVLIVNLLDPNEKTTLNVPLYYWRNLLLDNNIFSYVDDPHEERVNFFFSALAFNFKLKESLFLFEYSLEYVYNRLLKNNQYPLNWELLVKHTQPLFLQDWDKCKKIRYAIADKIIESKLSEDVLHKLIRNSETRKDFKKAYNKRKNKGFFDF